MPSAQTKQRTADARAHDRKLAAASRKTKPKAAKKPARKAAGRKR